MKILVIISHPYMEQSSLQQFLLAVTRDEPAIEVRHLESVLAKTKTGSFDRQVEQQLLSQADRIILQFPFYWYQCPSVMKQWIDEVFSQAFSKEYAKKELGVVVSLGAKQEEYQAGASVGFTVAELLRPYQALANHLGWQYLSPFCIYQFVYWSETQKQQLLVDYLYYLEQGQPSFSNREQWLLDRIQLYEGEQWKQIKEWLNDFRYEQENLALLLSEMEEDDGV